MAINRKDIASVREEYMKGELNEKDVHSNPIRQFEWWFSEAIDSSVAEPTAMVLSTADLLGQPSSRVVLLKDVRSNGFVFFTNYLSRKAEDMSENPRVALLFFWRELQRQVRIEGSVEKISEQDSTEYFLSRPKGSQIGAIASPQSQIIGSRDELESRFKELDTLYSAQDIVERPEYWGGYLVTPHRFEFWQGRESRLHDRIQYVWSGGQWIVQRLAP